MKVYSFEKGLIYEQETEERQSLLQSAEYISRTLSTPFSVTCRKELIITRVGPYGIVRAQGVGDLWIIRGSVL